jgi:hypothetical protein
MIYDLRFTVGRDDNASVQSPSNPTSAIRHFPAR